MIPTLDLRRLNAERKYSSDLEFEFEPEEGTVGIPYVELVPPVKAKLHVEIAEDNTVSIKGKVIYTLKGLCSRCLKETKNQVEGDAEGIFVPVSRKGEDEDYTYSGSVIDLKEFLKEAVLFSIPNGLYCSETCSAPEYK